jgi:hypothetical protein
LMDNLNFLLDRRAIDYYFGSIRDVLLHDVPIRLGETSSVPFADAGGPMI